MTVDYLTSTILRSDRPVWVNPVGGLGDTIMVSTAMFRSFERYGKKFNIARRTAYTQMFSDHPAVERIGNPTPDDLLIMTDYWSRPEFETDGMTALSTLLKMFGSEPDPEARLYLPRYTDAALEMLLLALPGEDGRRVVVSPESDSPRKITARERWERLVALLLDAGLTVIQTGRSYETPLPGAYSLLGATTPRQLPEIIREADLVITPDSYAMHAARAVETPCLALFGPTDAARYHYPEGGRAVVGECPLGQLCLATATRSAYVSECPVEESKRCTAADPGALAALALEMLKIKNGKDITQNGKR